VNGAGGFKGNSRAERLKEVETSSLLNYGFCVSPKIQDLRQLPLSERIQLVEDLWDTIAEDSPGIGLSPEHIAELDRRLDALEAQPNSGTPWETARKRILGAL